MSTQNNFSTSFKGIFLLAYLGFSTFLILLLSFEYYDNYKIISNKNQMEKIDVKIDSVNVSTTRSGKSSSTTSSVNYYYNKGLFFEAQINKGILVKYDNPIGKIESYMSHHNDSLKLWVLDKKAVKFANKNEKIIDVSEEIKNNWIISVYFLIYIISLLIIKFKF